MSERPSIDDLIRETERWLAEHKAARRWIEAAACQIRLRALRDAKAAARAALGLGTSE